ncbi:hypothetical protein GIW37_11455, partial [Pseudomonas syringae]|nr:hypothetical protein [Pseudomonas syringae]
PSRTSSLLQKPPCLSVRQKCRSELVRERARTAAEDLAFKTPPSRTSSLLQKPGPTVSTIQGRRLRTTVLRSARRASPRSATRNTG